MIEQLDLKMERLVGAFSKILYEDDAIFMENMKTSNLAGDDIAKYKHWEWPQGVGLFGLWKLYESTGVQSYIEMIEKYYDRQLEIGLPSLNVNTIAPLLTLSFLAEKTGDEAYMKPCVEAAKWIMEEFPRTKEDGLQHITSDTVNHQELWDDTLFMTVLFLGNMARILNNEAYKQEAIYQFLLHIKYLQDSKTGLFYHGWTFDGNHNFTEVFWGRGNCWVTMVIPEFLGMVEVEPAVEKFLGTVLTQQVASLQECQNKNGMWHTVVDDPDSYVEASATCGFAYGILRGIDRGILPESAKTMATAALAPILDYIDENGVMNQVSYGTAMGRDSKDFYQTIPIMPMPYGQAMAILFLEEYKRWV